MPATSTSSYLNAATSSTSSLLLSSISASAAAWSMLKRRTTVCWKMRMLSCPALECLQNATSALQASNHSARIWWVEVQPSQKRAYAWEVRNTMRNPTRNMNPLHVAVSRKMLSVSPSPIACSSPRSMYHFKPNVAAAHGDATKKAKGKTLPLHWKTFKKKWAPPRWYVIMAARAVEGGRKGGRSSGGARGVGAAPAAGAPAST
mmetsp:Transcript_69421/g.187669  ORF Transcript_69421/g.187669 Transcript_69421/m.187669 type:complete len:204 (+) Transcript_69421:1451-2062(+)